MRRRHVAAVQAFMGGYSERVSGQGHQCRGCSQTDSDKRSQGHQLAGSQRQVEARV
jgi:hypothetical protein